MSTYACLTVVPPKKKSGPKESASKWGKPMKYLYSSLCRKRSLCGWRRGFVVSLSLGQGIKCIWFVAVVLPCILQRPRAQSLELWQQKCPQVKVPCFNEVHMLLCLVAYGALNVWFRNSKSLSRFLLLLALVGVVNLLRKTTDISSTCDPFWVHLSEEIAT